VARNKITRRKRLTPPLACFRSSITNGTALLHNVDARSQSMRRLRDIIAAHQADLGGAGLLSEAQTSLLRRAALLQLQLEMSEAKFAQREDGVATANEMTAYQRISNTLRRLLESLNLHKGRQSRDITPQFDTRAIVKAARQAHPS